MEVSDVLKIQNRYLDTQIQTESIKSLKDFNNELIESERFPISWRIVSNKVIDFLLANGFYFDGYNRRGFRNDGSPTKMLYKIEGQLVFFYGYKQMEIEPEQLESEFFLHTLIELK